MRDLKSNIKPVQSLVPATRSAAANGTSVDLSGFNAASVIFSNGAIGGTASPAFTFEVQESDDNANFVAVVDKDLRGVEPVIVAANQVSQVSYIGCKRYIRAALKTVTGTSPTLDCAAHVILGHPANAPTV
ncbi:hypothetical protein HH212_26225 [Massilia forsythiae]|uniref:Head decoration protein n=1 Tax=Massilia forsythiae TaxID=2728020 RepID=A0A7Z2ZUU8_9BURK|nr:hypothetical protein [Massilia forsythiae]QJE03056.1 hypothetical protein HH212_26225 [Massilia forsythiae]